MYPDTQGPARAYPRHDKTCQRDPELSRRGSSRCCGALRQSQRTSARRPDGKALRRARNFALVELAVPHAATEPSQGPRFRLARRWLPYCTAGGVEDGCRTAPREACDVAPRTRNISRRRRIHGANPCRRGARAISLRSVPTRQVMARSGLGLTRLSLAENRLGTLVRKYMIRSASDRTECAGSNATSAIPWKRRLLRRSSHHRHLLSCAA
jgi:hypothetical protein